MMYDSMLARSFSKHEQKKFRFGAFIASLLIAFSFFTVFKPYLVPLPVLKLRLSMGAGLKMLMLKDDNKSILKKIAKDSGSSATGNIFGSLIISKSRHIVDDEFNSSRIFLQNTSRFHHEVDHHTDTTKQISQVADLVPVKKTQQLCNILKRSDFCEIRDHDDIRINGSSATIFLSSTHHHQPENSSSIIRPYARKGDQAAMNRVKEWTVKSSTSQQQDIPKCTKNHDIPAVLFSTGGYAGNHFHDFTDIIIPLYITSREFNGEVQFLVTNKQPWWIQKYKKLLKKLSNYDIIDIDISEKETNTIHCFTRGIIVGLKRYDDKELNIDDTKSSFSMKDFRAFLRSTYSLPKSSAIKLKQNNGEKRKPRLLIVARKRTRAFSNTAMIVKLAKKLGFRVIVSEADMKVSRFAQFVNSCDVLLGVHGAGLTNMVFLPENAVFIQVIPYGGMEWLARTDFEEPSKKMNLKYMDYRIKLEESSLIEQYPVDHPVIKDPESIGKKGWNVFKSVYMSNQNVKIDLNRLRGVLLKARLLLSE